MTYASVDWVIIGSGNGLLPVWQQAITWTNADLLSNGPIETNFRENLIKIGWFLFKEIYLQMLFTELWTVYSCLKVLSFQHDNSQVNLDSVCKWLIHDSWYHLIRYVPDETSFNNLKQLEKNNVIVFQYLKWCQNYNIFIIKIFMACIIQAGFYHTQYMDWVTEKVPFSQW